MSEMLSRTEREMGIHPSQLAKKRKKKLVKGPPSQSQHQKDSSDDSDFEDRQKIIATLPGSASQTQPSDSNRKGVKSTARKHARPQIYYMKKGATGVGLSSPTRSSPRLNKSSTPTRASARFDPAEKNESLVHGKKAPKVEPKIKAKNIEEKVPYSNPLGNQDAMEVDASDSDPVILSYKPPAPPASLMHIYEETLKYSEWWSVMFLANTPPTTFDFPERSENWSPTDGIFTDLGGVPLGDKPPVIKDRDYPGREEVSDVVTGLLDYWVGCLWSGHFTGPRESAYYHHKSGATFSVREFGRLVYGYSIEADVVNALFNYMMRETPVDAPWFYISPYTATIIHSWNMTYVAQSYPYVFTDPMDKAKWAFMPLVGDGHYVLLAADICNVKIMFLNSLGRTAKRNPCLKLHSFPIKWLKQFLSWRMDNPAWKEVDVEVSKSIPKQDGTLDCGLFVVRYAYCLLNDLPMDFTQT